MTSTLDEVRDANAYLRIENASLRARLEACQEEHDELQDLVEHFAFKTDWNEERKKAGGTWLRVLCKFVRSLLDVSVYHANDWEIGSIDLAHQFDELMAERTVGADVPAARTVGADPRAARLPKGGAA